MLVRRYLIKFKIGEGPKCVKLQSLQSPFISHFQLSVFATARKEKNTYMPGVTGVGVRAEVGGGVGVVTGERVDSGAAINNVESARWKQVGRSKCGRIVQ